MKRAFQSLSLALLLGLLCIQVGGAQAADDGSSAANNASESSGAGGFRLLLPLIIDNQSTAVEAAAQSDAASTPLLADGQFVDGPNVGDFDVTSYLVAHQSPLLPYALDVSDKASYYSVNPRLVLTLIELLYPHSVLPNETTSASTPLPDQQAFDRLLEDLLMSLTEQFYGQLYGRNLAVETAGQYRAPRIVTFADGESIQFVFEQNPASDAIQVVLAKQFQQAAWQRLAQKDAPTSFVATYQRLFPESDPLDDSNRIHPDDIPPEGLLHAASAPPTLLKFPFAAGDTWRFTGGPHAYDGCTDNVFSAIDFAPVGYSGCSDPIAEDRWIAAAAGGTVNAVTCGGCNVSIDHGNGWGTRFYHVVNPQVVKGQIIQADTLIGNPSCAPMGVACGACGGSATGVHQHIDLRYNGAFVPIEGTQFEGWTVHGEACYQGYLEKDGTKLYPPTKITSMPDRIAPTATVTLTGELGALDWYRMPVTLTLSGIDNRGVNKIVYQIQRSDELTTAAWLTHTGTILTLTLASDGIYSISAKVIDQAGNPSPIATVQLQIDSTPPQNPPVSEVNCGVSDQSWQNFCNNPTFSWPSAEDIGSGSAAYEIAWGSDPLSPTLNFSTTATSFTPPVVDEGEYRLRLRSVDQVGNWSDWTTTFHLRYDTSPPVGSLLLNDGAIIARTPLITVSSEVSDTLSGVSAVRLRNGEGEWSEWLDYATPLGWHLSGMNGEEVVVAAQLQDGAGNLSAPISDTIWLDTQVAQAASSRFRLVRSTTGTTNSNALSSRYRLKGSLGQSFVTSATHSAQYNVASGYWRSALPADLLPAPTRTPPVEMLPCTIAIDDEAAFTRQNDVTITMNITAAVTMQVVSTLPLTEADWQPYTDTIPLHFNVATDQITQLTAFASFRSANATLCSGSWVSDTIRYDPLPPLAQIALVNQTADNNPREPVGGSVQVLQINASDQSDGSGVADMQIATNPDFAGSDWQPFANEVTLPTGDWDTLYVRVRDHAGNVSATAVLANQAVRRVFLPLLRR